jgi:DnaJ-domain-containing protein 1
MVEKGTETYKADALKRQYNKLMVDNKDLRAVAVAHKEVAKEAAKEAEEAAMDGE